MPLAERSSEPRRIVRSVAGWEDDPHLEQALDHGLGLPLAALRASVEALSAELRTNALPAVLPGVLGEVERLGRNVAHLLDFARPLVPRPLRCTVEELLVAALQGLDRASRARVLIARTRPTEAFEVDGPLLAAALRRLVENALDAGGGEVLLAARQDAAGVVFSVVNHASLPFDPQWACVPFHTAKPNRVGLGLSLAAREVEAVGGRLSVTCGPAGETCASVQLPEPAPSGAQERAA